MATRAPEPAVNSTESVVTLTTTELWIQLIVVYGLIGGVLSTTLSVMIWLGIMKNKKLHTRFYVIVGCLTFVRTGISIEFILLSFFRSLRTAGLFDTYQKRIVCHFIHIFLVYSGSAELSLMLTLVIDRLIAVSSVHYYRSLTAKSAFRLCVIEYVFILFIKLIPSYIGIDMFELAPCVNWNSCLNRTYITYSTNFDLALVIVVVVVYFFLILYIRLKVNILRVLDSNRIDSHARLMAMNRQLKLIPTLRIVVWMHCVFKLVSRLFFWMATVMPRYGQRLVALGASVLVIDLVANYALLLLANPEIRHAAISRAS